MEKFLMGVLAILSERSERTCGKAEFGTRNAKRGTGNGKGILAQRARGFLCVSSFTFFVALVVNRI